MYQKFLNPKHVLDQIEMSPGICFADFGSGAGDFALEAIKIIGENGVVSAIDIQDSALSSVRSKARIEGVVQYINIIKANLEVDQGSTLKSSSQDIVLLANILFQTQQKQAILKESFRVLKQDGMLLFIDWKKDALPGLQRGWRLDEAQIKNMIEDEGFILKRDIDTGAYHFGMVFTKNVK